MVLVDSNIIIFASKPEYFYLREYLSTTPHCVSIVTMIEVLGHTSITPQEQVFLDAFFTVSEVIDVSPPVKDGAISLRKIKRVSLGDSIIAATALSQDIPLATNNIKDFSWIENLQLINPIKQ